MKATRIVSLGLLAIAAIGFNAQAQSADAGPDLLKNFVSSANPAQVHNDAVQANLERFQRGYSNDAGAFLTGNPVFMSTVTRDSVQMQALKAKLDQRVTEAG